MENIIHRRARKRWHLESGQPIVIRNEFRILEREIYEYQDTLVLLLFDYLRTSFHVLHSMMLGVMRGLAEAHPSERRLQYPL